MTIPVKQGLFHFERPCVKFAEIQHVLLMLFTELVDKIRAWFGGK
jgi:hypothetical protein